MKFILPLALFLVGCAIPTIKTNKPKKLNYTERMQIKIQSCISRLNNEGFDQQLIYPICKDIYERKTRIKRFKRRGRLETPRRTNI